MTYEEIYEQQLKENPSKLPPCPKCGNQMIDISGFIICGSQCTKCDFGIADGGGY